MFTSSKTWDKTEMSIKERLNKLSMVISYFSVWNKDYLCKHEYTLVTKLSKKLQHNVYYDNTFVKSKNYMFVNETGHSG